MALPVASIQLYTLAEEFSADMNGSLERLAAIGLKNVEAFDFVRRPDEIKAALDAAGLASPTGHAPLCPRFQRYRRRQQRILQLGATDHRRRHTSRLHGGSCRSADPGHSLHEDRNHSHEKTSTS